MEDEKREWNEGKWMKMNEMEEDEKREWNEDEVK